MNARGGPGAGTPAGGSAPVDRRGVPLDGDGGAAGRSAAGRAAVSSPVLEVGSGSYPALLAAIYDPPPRLYLRGAGHALLHGPCVGLVGARACSHYGRQVARLLGRELAAAGAVVVSGLARGVDAEAHRGALEADGATLAVLGCGIDRDYPASHAELARRIAATGLIVSEYGPGVPPAPWQFPARNRIIAGLCAVVVVVEARERSGALITADFALEEGREVLAVPGPITSSLSSGTNALLRAGATPLLTSGDVLEALGLEPVEPHPALAPAQSRVLRALGEGAADVDTLAGRTGLAAGEISGVLVELELDGLVAVDDGIVCVLAGRGGGAVRGGRAGSDRARPPPGRDPVPSISGPPTRAPAEESCPVI